MVAVTDNFAVHGTKSESSAYKTVGTVVKRSHSVIYMCHAGSTICISKNCFFIGSSRVSDTYNYTMFCQIFYKCKIIIGFCRHGNIFDISFSSSLITFKLFYGSFYDKLFRLCSFVFHIKVRTFKMNS